VHMWGHEPADATTMHSSMSCVGCRVIDDGCGGRSGPPQCGAGSVFVTLFLSFWLSLLPSISFRFFLKAIQSDE